MPSLSRLIPARLRRADGELTSLGRLVRRAGVGRLAYHAYHRPRMWWRRNRLSAEAIRTPLFGYTFHGPAPKFNPLSASIVASHIWEPALTAAVRQAVKPGSVVIDVGADLGYYVLLAAAHNDGAPILAFEPNSVNQEFLRRNISDNNLSSVQVIQAALGNSSGKIFLRSAEARMDADSEPSTDGEWVPLHRFDDIVGDLSAAPITVHVVIIDVEGAELEVLRGMDETIRRDRPVVFVEIHGPFLSGFQASTADVVRWFEERSYAAEWLAGDPLSASGFSHVAFRPTPTA